MFVDWFVSPYDPSRLTNFIFAGLPQVPEESDTPQTSWPIGKALDHAVFRKLLVPGPTFLNSLRRSYNRCLLLFDHNRCFTGQLNNNAPLIVDTGALVCNSPRKEDFVTYQPSKMKTKDLSSSNKVAGEGMLSEEA